MPTVIDSARVAERLPESITFTVKSDWPAVVGEPEITPVEGSRLSPAASVPVATDHV